MVSMGSDWQILQKMDLWLQESMHFEDKPGTCVVGYTLWLFNIAMENGSSIDDFRIQNGAFSLSKASRYVPRLGSIAC
jgi:hypothetical protein